MRLVVFIAFILTLHVTNGQPSFCGSKNPFPDKILTIQEEIELKNKTDTLYIRESKSLKDVFKVITNVTTYGKPLDSIYYFWGKLKKLQSEIIKLSRATFIDTTSKYKLLFIEDYDWKEEPFGISSNFYNISQFDSVINGREFFKKEKQLFTHSYSYNNQYLIMEECHQYIGNSSWGNRKVYYFEKVKE